MERVNNSISCILPVDSVPPMQISKTRENLTSIIANHWFLKRAILPKQLVN
jgi:hypothetical protein